MIKDQQSSTINAQIHDHPNMNGGNSTGTLTRQNRDLQIFFFEGTHWQEEQDLVEAPPLEPKKR